MRIDILDSLIRLALISKKGFIDKNENGDKDNSNVLYSKVEIDISSIHTLLISFHLPYSLNIELSLKIVELL